MISQEEYKVHYQSVRELYIKIQLLDGVTERVIDELQGVCVDGNINIKANQDIFRTCNLTMVVKNQSYLPSPSSRIWMNRKFRVFTGIKNLVTGEIVWFNKNNGGYGLFVMNKPVIDSTLTHTTLSIEGLDKMCLMNGKLDGYLAKAVEFKLPVGTPIDSAVRSTWQQLGGETKLNIDSATSGMTLPYTIEKKPNDTVYSILKEINDLYMGWQVFYDTNGYGVYTKIKNRLTDPIAWDFTDFDFRVDSKSEPDFENIFNAVWVWGKKKTDGTQIKAYKENTDIKNPFSIPNLYKKEMTVTDDKIFTQEQANVRTDYELMKHGNLNEKISISCLPIYVLKENDIIYFNKPEDGLVGKYLVDELSFNLKYDSLMSINAHKLYN